MKARIILVLKDDENCAVQSTLNDELDVQQIADRKIILGVDPENLQALLERLKYHSPTFDRLNPQHQLIIEFR